MAQHQHRRSGGPCQSRSSRSASCEDKLCYVYCLLGPKTKVRGVGGGKGWGLSDSLAGPIRFQIPVASGGVQISGKKKGADICRHAGLGGLLVLLTLCVLDSGLLRCSFFWFWRP